ncbi:MAG: tetratricopeptide repeat protein [Myxococcales bacterium]|nr:tetratricopeptide repeat protein [Myxococcales bacterium]
MRRAIFAALAAFAAWGCRHAGDGASLTPRELAHFHLHRGQPEKAIPLLEELHALHPSDFDLARSLAEAHAKSGTARSLIDRLRAVKKPAAVTHYMLGLSLFSRAADAAGPAISELRQAAELAPAEPEAHHRLGVALLECERYEEALPPLERARELAPDRPAYALPLAKAYYRNGNRQRAVEAIRAVVSSEPSPAEVKVARALMDAIADPFATLPRAARPKLELGMAWLFDRDIPQQAAISFEELLREYPDLSVVHALLGLCYQRLDDAGRAVDELRRAIELAPDDGKNHLYLGELYLGRQRPEQAREHLERALALNPVLGEAHHRLGELALERGELDQAQPHFRALTFLEPDSHAPRTKLAVVLKLKGDFAGAERELHRVLERDPSSTEAKLGLGLLHAEKNGRARTKEERAATRREAARWLEEVLAVQPDHALASRALEGLK